MSAFDHNMNNNDLDTGFVDIHCHCLCGLDDGPADMTGSIDLCSSLVDNGISTVIATPHQLGRYALANKASQIRQSINELREQLHQNNIPLNVLAGADVRVDERLCGLIRSDIVMTLADGGRYLLLELPHGIFIDIEPLLGDLYAMGIQTIISHPERHTVLSKRRGILRKWSSYFISLQISAASLTGDFGQDAYHAAWKFINSDFPCIIATDAHSSQHRKPKMKQAYQAVCQRLGQEIATRLCKENPRRVVENQDIIVQTRYKISSVKKSENKYYEPSCQKI